MEVRKGDKEVEVRGWVRELMNDFIFFPAPPLRSYLLIAFVRLRRFSRGFGTSGLHNKNP